MLKADRTIALGYGLSIIATGSAWALTWAAGPLLPGCPYLLFFASGAVSAWYGGMGPGVLATLLAAGGSFHFLYLAVGSPSIGYPRFAALDVFVLVSLLVCTLIASSRTKLRRAREEARFLFDSAPVAIQWADADGTIRRANPAALDLLGYAADEYVGRPFADFGADPDEARNFLRRAVTGEALRGREAALRAKDGSVRRVRIDSDLLVEGRTVILRSFLRDITEEKRTEEALRVAMEEAEAASQAKDRFFAALSHELRAPLTPVLIAAAQQEEEASLPEENRHLNELIRRNVELEARLIDNLLDLTLIQQGKLELDVNTVNAHALIKNVAEICQSDLNGKGIDLEVDLRANRSHVRGDSARLHQVFWNLVRNAIKFTPVNGRITLRSMDSPGGRLRVQVIDDGIGIERSELPRIFEAFDRPDRGRFGGLGLGLPISRAIVEAHHGTLSAESKGKGQGATFTVEIPALEIPYAGQPLSKLLTPESGRQPLRILLVEDHEDSARLIAQLLRKFNYEVTTAGTVTDALRAAGEEEFHILVSDIGLPDGNGLELLGELKKRWPIRGIALTGFGMEADVKMSREAGFEEHLIKPVNFHKLQMALQRVAPAAMPAGTDGA